MANTTSSIRNLNELHPLVKTLAELALQEIRDYGINPLVVETYRSKERQYYLYCKGRSYDEAVKGGVPAAKAKKYIDQLKAEKYTGGKVTWTLNSIHIKRQAIDVVPQRIVNGKMTAIWNAKDPETKKIIATMSKYGFEAGANWKNNPDSPHFQVKGTLAKTVFKRGYTTYYVTLAIQKALNQVPNLLKVKLVEDGKWGDKTDEAVIAFRKYMKYKNKTAILGSEALKALFSFTK